jgi:hypothetical protein
LSANRVTIPRGFFTSNFFTQRANKDAETDADQPSHKLSANPPLQLASIATIVPHTHHHQHVVDIAQHKRTLRKTA